jgi:predicted ribosome quality control (RQC) complex YloA/Tae2 family protein
MVSNALLYDPLLVHYLARELDEAMRGRACAGAPHFAAELTATLPLAGGEALRLDLHPTRGWVRILPHDAVQDELDATCLGVEAPPDERLIIIHMRTTDRFRVGERKLVLELQTNQWNAALVNAQDDRLLTVMRSRAAGDRVLRPGQPYVPPAPVRRYGANDVARGDAIERWTGTLAGVAPDQRKSFLLKSFAYTGTLNAPALLGDAAREEDPAALSAAFRQWWDLRELGPAEPVLLRVAGRTVPYPRKLAGVESKPVPSLLEGMAALADGMQAEPQPDLEAELLLRRVDSRIAAAIRKVSRLQQQIAKPGEVAQLRAYGDLLLSNLRLVPRGVDRVRLMGWDRSIVEIGLDPTLSPAENAARWYDEAKRRARADERLPGLLESASVELDRWRTARQQAEGGALPGWAVRELERSTRSTESGAASDQEQARPYRLFRTAGGLEVRVGRSARENDRLTFGNSSPNDIWLHARSVAGSHVILRWSEPEANPPARDLEEAATLAALFSKARTSALVPVDWTRRKHVRKPRGAPPGAVIPQRVKTLFVTPDVAAEDRMKE